MSEPKIAGGYFLLERKIIESEIFKKPPLYLKAWIYLLQKAQHSSYKQLKRGQVRTSIPEIFVNYLPCDEMIKYGKYSPTEKYGCLRERLEKEHFQNNSNLYKVILLRTIYDYISGMTDKYSLEQYQLLYGIK